MVTPLKKRGLKRGGIITGGLGILFLHNRLKAGHLSTVMAIAHRLSVVIGAIPGYLFPHKQPSAIQIPGILPCAAGAALVTHFRTA